MNVTIETLKTDHPDLYQQLVTEIRGAEGQRFTMLHAAAGDDLDLLATAFTERWTQLRTLEERNQRLRRQLDALNTTPIPDKGH